MIFPFLDSALNAICILVRRLEDQTKYVLLRVAFQNRYEFKDITYSYETRRVKLHILFPIHFTNIFEQSLDLKLFYKRNLNNAE